MLGVIGGSGLYALLDRAEPAASTTPWGEPSAPVMVGDVDGRAVAFLARHGAHHELPPHRINYRANLWALREAGVTEILAPFAAGSLRPEIEPGHFVVCDQIVDRTSGRAGTFFDGPGANHVAFADPYCPRLRVAALTAGGAEGITVHDGGTVVVIDGPRFSTRAESRWYAAMGADVINMTQCPEAVLARELGLCYAGVALVTDYDAGLEGDPSVRPVSQQEVFAFLASNAERVRALVFRALSLAGGEPGGAACACADGPNGVEPSLP
jgi:5'-methylthioadenosine phosphorylase